MDYSYRYPAYPTQEVAVELEYHIDIHRQAYNYTLYEYENVDADNIGSAYKHHYRLPDWKDEFLVFSEVNLKALQRTVTRFYDNLSNLKDQKENGNKIGKLKWKSPREFQRTDRLTTSELTDYVVAAAFAIGENVTGS